MARIDSFRPAQRHKRHRDTAQAQTQDTDRHTHTSLTHTSHTNTSHTSHTHHTHITRRSVAHWTDLAGERAEHGPHRLFPRHARPFPLPRVPPPAPLARRRPLPAHTHTKMSQRHMQDYSALIFVIIVVICL
eukprot:1855057-Rhodomonas_salina.2